MKRNVYYLFMMLALLIGLGSCSNNDEDNQERELLSSGTTHMGFTIKVPSARNAKSADDPNYNMVGTYTGYTKINHLDIYLLTSDGQTLLMNRRFQNTEFVFGSSPTGEDMIRLTSPFKTVPGDKVMLVVINSPNAIHAIVPPDNFLYSSSTSNSLTPSTIINPQPSPTTPSSAPLSLAYVDMSTSITVGSDIMYEDVLVLAGKSTVFTIQDDITQQDVISTGVNMIDLNVIRVPSRAIITTTAPSTVVNSLGVTLGTISNLTYSVVQGANSVYLLPQLDANGFTQSWGYNYVPGPGAGLDYASNAPIYYDYSDISTLNRAIPARPASGNISVLPGVFLFETTHPYGTDASSTSYRKGTTPYILVRAQFAPDPAQIVGGGPLPADGTFYVGATDGRIYSSIADAQSYAYGSADQYVSTYTAGKVLYYVWLNPDNIQKPINSPVIRNNIYHVNINSFQSIGLNWNPLIPPGSSTPHNPDSQPSTGVEPPSLVNPNDPLSDSNTYMSVEVTVLNWTVHSYGVDL
jgi:hypothetical protein